MKQISLLFLFAVIVCCNMKAQITSAQLQNLVEKGIDPYFTETTDTVSVYGPRSITRNLLQDKRGNFWFATWQGIMSYNGKTFTNHTLKEGLIHFHVFSVYEDSRGNIWFGTVRGGLYRYDGKAFKLFTTKDGLPDNSISSMAEDKAGNIWLGSSAGVSRYDGKTFTNFSSKEGIGSVNAIIKDKTGKLWFGGDGITCYDGKNFSSFKNKEGSSFEGVASLFEDKTGNIWIGCRKGLCCYDGKVLSDFIIPNFVMYMCEDKKGNLWLAHNNYPANTNFSLYSYESKSFTKVLEQSADNWQIFGMMEDKNGNIWYGTMKGVCRLDVTQLENPCLKRTCHHNLPMREAIDEHKKEIAKSVNSFQKD
jgi:ligand-binding sensor domain-containing protein